MARAAHDNAAAEVGGLAAELVEKAGSESSGTCTGKGSLNTKISVTLPTGDKVNSTANLANGSWVGEAIGRAIACDGKESRIIYGGAALRSLKTWTASQCPTGVVACYEATATYNGTTGHGYSWVSESGVPGARMSPPSAIRSGQ